MARVISNKQRIFTLCVIILSTVDTCAGLMASTSLNVSNSNDHAPLFPTPISTFTIQAGNYTVEWYYVTQLEAEDSDQGSAGLVSYYIKGATDNGRGKFSLGTDGQLWVSGHVQAGDTIVLVLEARDGGQIARRDHTVAVLYITDTVADGPSFPAPLYTVRLPHGLKPGSHILTLQANDHLPSLNYSIVDGDLDSNFQIDPESGNLTLVKDVGSSSHNLSICVVDSEGLSAVTVVDIQVSPLISERSSCSCSGVNASGPLIPSPLYHVFIADNTPLNTSVFTIPVVGAGNNSLVFTGGDTAGYFTVDPLTGDVMVAQSLNGSDISSVDVTVAASDVDGESASTCLRVGITASSPRVLYNDASHVAYTMRTDVAAPGNAAPQSAASLLPVTLILALALHTSLH